jgi:hypothetical protein
VCQTLLKHVNILSCCVLRNKHPDKRASHTGNKEARTKMHQFTSILLANLYTFLFVPINCFVLRQQLINEVLGNGHPLPESILRARQLRPQHWQQRHHHKIEQLSDAIVSHGFTNLFML